MAFHEARRFTASDIWLAKPVLEMLDPGFS
jgi:hypothetical protein